MKIQKLSKNSSQHLTDNHKQICEKVGVSWEGNAAANSNNYLDLKGENIQVKRLPTGFTARGIVALVFSCIAAFLGIAAIAYYGMNDIEDVEERVARDLDVDLDEENEDEEEAEIVNEGSSSSGSNSKQH